MRAPSSGCAEYRYLSRARATVLRPPPCPLSSDGTHAPRAHARAPPPPLQLHHVIARAQLAHKVPQQRRARLLHDAQRVRVRAALTERQAVHHNTHREHVLQRLAHKAAAGEVGLVRDHRRLVAYAHGVLPAQRETHRAVRYVHPRAARVVTEHRIARWLHAPHVTVIHRPARAQQPAAHTPPAHQPRPPARHQRAPAGDAHGHAATLRHPRRRRQRTAGQLAPACPPSRGTARASANVSLANLSPAHCFSLLDVVAGRRSSSTRSVTSPPCCAARTHGPARAACWTAPRAAPACLAQRRHPR